MGRASQRKGRLAERELAQYLTVCGIEAFPGIPQSYGQTPDVVAPHTGLHIESKRAETLRLPAWLRQCEDDAQRFGGVPLLAFRQNRQPWRVCLTLDAFLKLLIAAGGKMPEPQEGLHNRVGNV